MIERRFIKGTAFPNIPVHVIQAIFAQVMIGDMTQGEANTEVNSSISDSLVSGEQSDLQAILNWIDGGADTTAKIARWHRVETVLMLGWHGGPKYGSESLLKSALENLIGGTLA